MSLYFLFYSRAREIHALLWREDVVLNIFYYFFLKGETMTALESKFQAKLIKELKQMFVGAIVTKVESYIQGFPDILILYGKQWAMLECKRESKSDKQPNQDYYVNKLNKMSFSSFINPENKEDVLNDLQRSFEIKRKPRIPVRK